MCQVPGILSTSTKHLPKQPMLYTIWHFSLCAAMSQAGGAPTVLCCQAQVEGEAWQDVVHVRRQPRERALLHGSQPGSNGTIWVSA